MTDFGHAAPSPTRSYFRHVLRRVLEDRRAWKWLLATALVEAGLVSMGPWIASHAIDTAIPNSAHRLLFGLSALTLLLAAQAAWAGWLQERVALGLIARLQVRCSGELLRSYLDAPYSTLRRGDFGEASETIEAGSQIVAALVRCIVECTTLVGTAFVALLLLTQADPALALVMLLAAAVAAASMTASAARQARHTEQILEQSSRSQQLLQVLLRAAATLRAFGASGRLTEVWSRTIQEQARTGLEEGRERLARELVSQAAQHLPAWLATAWLVQRAVTGQISVGDLIAFSLLATLLVRVATGLAETITNLLAMRPLVERVQRSQWASQVARAAREPNHGGGAPRGPIELRDVWFRYSEADPWALRGRDLVVPPGAHLVLQAPSGSGKSTLLRLLAGLLEPTRGNVSIGGLSPRDARLQVAYLPQQAALFEASIASNLTSLSGEPLERVLEIAELTGLSRLLDLLPMGVETLVSTGGGNLSAGQRQLVLLTAVLAKRCPVLLLDEPTSQLDPDTRARIRWPDLTAGRTVLSVQHV